VPNIIGMAPKDEDELVDMMFTATHQQHPTFIRYPRGAGEGVPLKEQPQLLEIGKAEILKPFAQKGGRRVAFLALGNMQKIAREAASRLESEGFDCALINPRFFKPIDQGTTEYFARTADLVVTLEDHVLMGGYGSAVCELMTEKQITTPAIRIGWPDQFIEHASSVDFLREKYGLTATAVTDKVRQFLGGAAAESAQKVAAIAGR
jgi:1-deoxy-D-xylulose-5-phosphate synthase